MAGRTGWLSSFLLYDDAHILLVLVVSGCEATKFCVDLRFFVADLRVILGVGLTPGVLSTF